MTYMSKTFGLFLKVTLLVVSLSLTAAPTGGPLGSIAKAVKKGYNNVRKTLKKAEKDARRETGKALHNTVREIGHGVENVGKVTKVGLKNIEAETMRVGPHTVSFGKAVGKYMERTVAGYAETIKDAGERVQEGKLADAFFHFALDPLTNTEDNLFKATQESGWINSAGAITAAAYGGAGGAAAYAAWQTYKSTDGNAELALRAGVLAGFSHMATEGLGQMQKTEDFGAVQKAVLAGAVGGLTVAAAGGDEKEVLEGFILAGGMVIIQDGYQDAVGHELDPRAAKSEPYCAAPGTEGCKVFDKAYYIDENGRPRINYSKLDPSASYVGEGYMYGVKRPPYSWTQDRSPFMRTVAKVPGFNAMGLFHDNWVLSWGMSDWQNKATIFPAVVMTYYGTGDPLNQKITDITIKSGKGPQKKLVRNDLEMEPNLVLAATMTDTRIPREFDLDPANKKLVANYHVARSNLVAPGKYLILRNINNGKIQRVVVIGGIPADKQSSAGSEILLSPLTIQSLGITQKQRIVQAEPEELILVSTIDPPAAEVVKDLEVAYMKKGDTLSFPDLDLDENTQWNLTIMGPGGGQIIEHFDNKWKADLRTGQYLYTLYIDEKEGQLPWCYYGHFKIISDGTPEQPGVWASGGADAATDEAAYLIVNGKQLKADGECIGNTAMMNTEDESMAVIMTNVPDGSTAVNADRFTNNCESCFSLMVTDITEGKTFVAVGGSFTKTGTTVFFEVDVKALTDFADPKGKTYKVKGRFIRED